MKDTEMMPFVKFLRRYVLVMMPIIITTSLARAFDLAPHQITYQLDLLEADPKTSISDISGKTIFRVYRDCDGWRSDEDYIMQMGFDDGNEIYLASLFESYEDFDGTLFSFTIDEQSTYEKPLSFDGFAQQSATQGGGSEAYFSIAPESAVRLPEDTFFPIEQTREILRRAKAGDTFFSSHIFFGAKPDDALKKTSVVIGKVQTANQDDPVSELIQDSYYPVNIAYFDPKSTNGIPSYEIAFHMQPNGVVPSYVIDYGDFKLHAKMSGIEKEPNPTCR